MSITRHSSLVSHSTLDSPSGRLMSSQRRSNASWKNSGCVISTGIGGTSSPHWCRLGQEHSRPKTGGNERTSNGGWNSRQHFHLPTCESSSGSSLFCLLLVETRPITNLAGYFSVGGIQSQSAASFAHHLLPHPFNLWAVGTEPGWAVPSSASSAPTGALHCEFLLVLIFLGQSHNRWVSCWLHHCGEVLSFTEGRSRKLCRDNFLTIDGFYKFVLHLIL